MTSPTPVGTAVVQIRAAVDKVKKDITDGVKAGWKSAEREAMAQGRSAGVKYAQGFNAGIKQGDIAGTINRQFRAAEREAGAAGGRAGARYAAAFNLAAKSANPPTTEPNRPTTVRPPRTPNNGGNAGGGGGSPGTQAATDRAAQAVQRNTKSTHTITTRLDNAATTVLRGELAAVQRSLMVITLLSKGALAGIAAPAALSSIAAITAAVSSLSGALALIPAGINAIALPIAAFKLGTAGIMDAFKATSEAGKNTEQTAKAVAAAQKSVTSAQRGIVSATQNVASAERGVAAATRGTERARESLNDTIKDQIRQLRDLNMELKGSALDEEDATLAVERARERLANMPSDSTALDYKEANLAIRQAQQRLDEVRVSNADLRIDVRKANEEGVEGSRAVRDARQGVADAVQGEVDANQNLINSQQSLADANDALAEAIQGVQDAAKSGGVDKYAEAMAKLSENGKDFVTKVSSLSGAFDTLKKQVQEPMFANLGDDVVNLFNVFTEGDNVLGNGLARISGGFNQIARDVIKAFAAPDSVEKFGFVIEQIGIMMEKLAPGIFALVGVFKNLSFVGSKFFPGFADGFTNVAQKMERWTNDPNAGLPAIEAMIRRALDTGKMLFSIVGTGIDILKNVFANAIEPGERILTVVGNVFQRVDDVTNSVSGDTALKDFFNNGATAIESLEKALGDVILIIGDSLLTLSGFGADIAPGLSTFIENLRTGLGNLQPAFDYLGPKISEIFDQVGQYLPAIGDAFSSVVTGMDPFISTIMWLVDLIFPKIVSFIDWIGPAIGPLALLLTTLALGWKGVSLAMQGFQFFEDGVGGAMDKVKDKLRGQSDDTNTKERRTGVLNETLEDLQTEESQTGDRVDTTADAIRRSTDAVEERNTAVDNTPAPWLGPRWDDQSAAPPEGGRGTAPSASSRNTTGSRVADLSGRATPIGMIDSSQTVLSSSRSSTARSSVPFGFSNDRSNVATALRSTRESTTSQPFGFSSDRGTTASTVRAAVADAVEEDEEDTTPARPRRAARVAGAAKATAGAGLGAGLGAATIGSALVSVGGEEGLAGTASLVTGTVAALASGDFSTALGNFGSLQEGVEGITDGFSQMKDSLSGVGDMAKNAFTTLKESPKTIKDGFNTAKDAVGKTGGKLKDAGTAVKNWNIGAKISQGITKAWTGIQAAFNIVMSANPIALVVIAIAALVAAIVIAYKNSETFRNIVQACWEGIQTAISFAWNSVIKPVWDALLVALRAVGDFFVWVWESVIKPAWSALSEGIKWYWENVIGTAFDALKFALGAIGDFFKWVWESVIQPAWNALGDGIAWVWDNVISKAFDAIKGGLTGVKDWFSSMVDTIETLWNKIIDIVKVPVRFVIDKVYNQGIVKAWNGIAGLIGMDDKKLTEMSLEGFSTGGIPEKKTGVMSGYSPGRDDRLIAVGGGEAVMRPEVTRAVGPGWVNGANASARNGGVSGVKRFLGAYADGGIVESMTSAVKGKFPMIDMTSGLRFTDNGYHSKGMAADFSNGGDEGTPEMQALAGWIRANFMGPTIQLIHHPFNANVGDGADVGDGMGYYGAGTMEGHRNHVHWAVSTPVDADGAGAEPESGWFSKMVSAGVGAVRGGAASLFDKAMSPVRSMIEKATEITGAGEFGKIPLALFDKVNGTLSEKIRGSSGGGSGPDALWEPSAGAEQWRGMMIEAYKNQGYEPLPEKIDAWVRQIDTESTGDPNVAQKIVDVNGTGEEAGVGLGQMIPTTWQAYRDPALPDNRRDPWAMTNAMVRYGEQKYGDQLLSMIGQGHGYDNGGWLKPGLTLANNQSGVPEPVFTGAQWDLLKQGLNMNAGDEYLKNNLPNLQTGLQDLAVDAFKETVVGGLFGEETFGLDGLINKAVDQAVADASKSGNGFGQPPVSEGERQANAGIVAQEVNFYGMDPQKVNEEVTRAVGAGMTPVGGRYREP